MNDAENDLLEEISSFDKDPVGFAEFAYPWGEDDLESSKGQRDWQRDVGADIRDHLNNPKTRFTPLLIAVASGHGIGKSADIAQIIHWAMSTCEDTKIVVTANTETQLRTKTWPEISKWFRLAINAHWFNVTATAVASVQKSHERSWRADAITWSINNTEAFAGLHNKGKRIVVIFDEASSIADKVFEVTEGALTDENTEIIWIAYGNPTRNNGRFRDCFARFKHRWKCRQIDSRDVEGTNKAQIDKWIEDYGIDSDFVKVRVRGIFPTTSFKQYISTEDVDRAYGKELSPENYKWAPKIITLDPAWEGDDELVIGLRQGLSFRILKTMAKNDNDVFVANILADFEDEEEADAVFIDGGYGTGVVSVGRTLKRTWQLVWFGEKSFDEGCLNKRAEMWKNLKEWLKEGGSIPMDPVLRDEIIAPETVPRLDGILQLEAKKDMKSRGVPSPNRADALALSFAYSVSSKNLKRNKKRELTYPQGGGQGWMFEK